MYQDTLNTEKAGTAKGRARVYRLLSALYLKEVTPEIISVLLQDEVKGMLSNLNINIADLLSDASQDEFLNNLAEEYAALFIVSGGIPPYESVRLKGLLCQDPSWAVGEFYKRCGLAIKEDCNIFPDHIGMELDFMGYLADRESDAWEDADSGTAIKYLNLQKEFFNSHIINWVYGFLDDLEKYAFHPFYNEISKLTRNFLDSEREYTEGEDKQ